MANSLSLLNFDVLVKNVQGLDDVGPDFENKIRTKAIRQVMPSINFITRYNVADIKSQQKVMNCGDTPNDVLEKVIMKVL